MRDACRDDDVWYIHTMPRVSTPPNGPGRARVVRRLDELDDALVGVRRVLQRPEYRRRLLTALDVPVEMSTLRVLRAVERSECCPVSIGDVAEVLTVDPSTASRLVDRCADQQLLARRPSEGDRRRSELELTPEGRMLLDRAKQARRDVLAEITEDWPEEHTGRLVELLQALLDGFERLEAGA